VAGRVPVALYCHENQLTYPPVPGSKRDLHYGWINYVSSLASDAIFFNSRYHLEEWYDELPRLLKHFPDFNDLERVPALRERSRVLYPGVNLRRLDQPAEYSGIPLRGAPGEPPLILWNHRWEFDKNPQEFFRLLGRLDDLGLPFRLAIAGESFRNSPTEFLEARQRFGKRLVHFGYASAGQYRALLQRSDIVISTAIHEFFGIAIVEAIYAGCAPLLPWRLAYPELILPEKHDLFLYHDSGDALKRLQQWLSEGVPEIEALRAHVARFDWQAITAEYDMIFEGLICQP
ncbi:MAG: tRNA-queuosine alpha-mannosyltransferase domain-containing protein, partial [Ardenticatenaceae bacterium]